MIAVKTKRRRITNEVYCSYATIDGGQIHFRSVDGEGVPLVFLHQTASSSSSFHAVLQQLNLPNRLVALDTPGFGGSFNPSGWPSLAKYAQWVIDTLHQLGIEQAHFCGHHTGGSFALKIAHRFPQSVKSVMLLGPVVMSAAERTEFRADFEQPITPREDGSHMVRNWDYAHLHNQNCNIEIIHAEVVNMLRAWKGRPQAYRAVSFQDSLALIRKVKVPMLLMSSPGDYFFPRFGGICAAKPDAKVAIVGGDNFPSLVDPAGVARAIEKFIAETF